MREIMVVNAKGGSGKTTIATNLASYYANRQMKVVLCDFDPQGSSLQWLRRRSPARPPIGGYDGVKKRGAARAKADVCIIDTPAALHGRALAQVVRRAQTLIVPVLPSPLDMTAATDFLRELRATPTVSGKRAKVALIGNRVRDYTNIAWHLDDFLRAQRIASPTLLRDSMNYIRAAEKGLGIFDMSPYLTQTDREQWKPLLRWLGNRRSSQP